MNGDDCDDVEKVSQKFQSLLAKIIPTLIRIFLCGSLGRTLGTDTRASPRDVLVLSRASSRQCAFSSQPSLDPGAIRRARPFGSS